MEEKRKKEEQFWEENKQLRDLAIHSLQAGQAPEAIFIV